MSDWLYTEERLRLRSDCLGMLLHNFGWELTEDNLPKHSMETLQGCAHDWVSQGNPSVDGLKEYFLQNYTG